MSDDKDDKKKKADDPSEIDWESALSDWESKSFVPEVAKEIVADKSGGAFSAQTASRPLYRPPPAPPPRPKAPPPPVKPIISLVDDDDDDGDGETVITEIPQELLRRKGPPSARPPPPATSRGGLGQFFARDDRRDAAASDESQAKGIARPRRELHQEGASPAPPPAAHRAEQLTMPAESEIDALLDAPSVQGDPYEAPTVTGRSILSLDDEPFDNDRAAMRGRRTDPPATPQPPPPPAPQATLPPPEPAPSKASKPREISHPREWEGERAASGWLDDSARSALRARASWLEEESRELTDDLSRARGLIACSELLAILGDRDRAGVLAAEARDIAPSLALAHRQARALMPSLAGPRAYIEALDREIETTAAGPARVHSMLLAAAGAAAEGDDADADRRLEQASQTAPTDVRVAVERVVRALERREPAFPTALRLPDTEELAPVAEALRACLRLRGITAADAGAKPSPNENLMRARQAMKAGDLSAAAPLIAELASLPELAQGAMWLAAALGATTKEQRSASAKWLRELTRTGEDDARRPLAARALELADIDLVTQAVAHSGPLSDADRLVLATLSNIEASADVHVEATAPMGALACAAAAVADATGTGGEAVARALARTKRSAGSPSSRTLVAIGRLLASSAAPSEIEAALDDLGAGATAATRAISLELAVNAGRVSDVSATLESWGTGRGSADEKTIAALASAIVAERAGDTVRALRGFKAARAADGTSEGALRAIASLEQVDMATEMNALANELGDGVRAAIARIEAVTLGEAGLPDPTQTHLLESAHRAAPTLPIASFLAERIARRAGDVDEVLRWLRDRRANASDPMEAALDAVREALLVADRDPRLAGERLREAHQARPGDIALRELHERTAPEPPDDRAAWREMRAQDATGDARTLLLLDAARERERAGDEEAALRCAEAAAASNSPLGRIARERAELRTGRVARLADELFSEAKSVGDPRLRLEAFERLADLDLMARHDPAGALLWHRSIFEEEPGHKPSLRYLEQYLIGEGRDEELEPIASAIAVALRGIGSPESAAHAELAARLRMRGAAGSWEATREMVELAAAEKDPSLWSLRMLQSHSRAHGDDATFLSVTKSLVERTSRPLEVATLLVRAGEAAARLGNGEEARELLERASFEDAGDVVAWELLVKVRTDAGDVRGAADASESLARSSVVPERQLGAWYDAGRLWQDQARDEDRALSAFEAAAAIDVAYRDVFDRLSQIYAARKKQPELADLLQRRMDCATDARERLTIEVQRGRILFEAGDVEGARRAFQSALTDHPDDAGALAAFTDLCLAQGDWQDAEQALIRLARLLSTPDEQRTVYANLGELYSHHLLNLPRAEVALKEVLKCAPDDVETMVKLVDVYKRQNDAQRSVELQLELVQRSRSPEEKRKRVIELASIHEQIARDNRKAEQALEGARREFPQDVGLLRALAEFYTRHRQTPAVNILLDRAGADARRALTAGRLAPASFEVLAAVFELRGRTDAARVSGAMLAALEGRPVELRGAGVARAFDPNLDDLLAPETLTPPLRGLLARAGDALDAVTPIDLRAMRAAPIAPDAPVARLAASAAEAIGLGGVTVLVSPKLGAVCIPVGSTPPTIVLGETLASDERIGTFLVLRALKLVRVNASALARTVPGELGVLVSAWLKCFNTSWDPQGINPNALSGALARIQAALPRHLDADLSVIALEVAGTIGTRQATLGPAALAWANRAAFLALGDPNAALDAIASAGAPGAVGVAGRPRAAPQDSKERAAWVARTPEARDLVAFGVTDAFAEARARLGLDR